GYTQIETTMDPTSVCALYQANRYDLILLDLQMPVMDGFEVMEQIKKIESDYLPVLVITAQPGHKLRALNGGARDVVSKPFDLVEVQTRIRNMLEVRLLYRKLADYNQVLERTVLERTAELRASEARFKSFTELSSDWYWEQDAQGNFTSVSGPVFEMLGIDPKQTATQAGSATDRNAAGRAQLAAKIAARQPFVDLLFTRSTADGRMQVLQVSGEPIFDDASRFAGYRGIGMDVTDRVAPTLPQ
ncbi:MAG: response regulator, partial [Lacisediminimonas sp.]|nr:response regulator [Lacisediminimonas sp.]